MRWSWPAGQADGRRRDYISAAATLWELLGLADREVVTSVERVERGVLALTRALAQSGVEPPRAAVDTSTIDVIESAVAPLRFRRR